MELGFRVARASFLDGGQWFWALGEFRGFRDSFVRAWGVGGGGGGGASGV